MPIKLQVRRGTAAQWAQVGVGDVVVLLNGEIGFETDTGNIKIGDGSLVWNNLPYQFPFVKNARGLDTTTLVIDQTTDFVGIGTNSPASKLHVEGTAPIVRLRDSAAPGATHVLLNADNADGSLTISADPGATGTAASKIFLATDGTTRLTIDETGQVLATNNIGIGTTTPAAILDIQVDAPVIRMRDNQATAGTHSLIDASNTTGSLTISADNGNNVNNSAITLKTDGTDRITIDSSLVTITPALTPSGGVTANTVALTAIANQTGPIVVGRQTATSGAVSALNMATVQSMLGLGADAYLNFFTARNLLDSNDATGSRWLLSSTQGASGNPALSGSGSYSVQYVYSCPISRLTVGKVTRVEYSSNVSRTITNFPTQYFRLAISGTGTETFVVLDSNLSSGAYLPVQSWFGTTLTFEDRYSVLTATVAGTPIIDYGVNPTGTRYAYILRLS